MALRYFSVFILITVTCLVPEVTSQGFGLLSSTAEGGVQEVTVPMCRGLIPYSHTKLPNSFGHSTQVEVHLLIEHLWGIMDYGCSRNFRLLVCTLYLPPYNPVTNSTAVPCRQTCMRARKKCKSVFQGSQRSWPRHLHCRQFPRPRQDRTCIKPFSERARDNAIPPTYCASSSLPLCQELPPPLLGGSLPNFFLQRNVSEIEIEMQFYTSLINSGCNGNLTMFLCGTYMPFCLNPWDSGYVAPCRELCEQVKADCMREYMISYQGLPWPNKLQCHRYVPADGLRPCVMPGDFN